MKAEKQKCPSCGGGGSNGITGDCSKCGGSGEVDVAKAEREAVAAGYKKVSLPDSGRCPNCGRFGHMVLECPALSSNFFKEKEKPSVADDEYHKDIAKAIHYPDCWDTMAYPTLVSALWEMVDVEGYLCPTCDKEQGMRGLLEKKEVLYIRPAPGTCCPEMNIKKGVCLGCGTKKKKPEKKKKNIDKRCKLC